MPFLGILRDLDFAACLHFHAPFKHPHSHTPRILTIQGLRTVTDMAQIQTLPWIDAPYNGQALEFDGVVFFQHALKFDLVLVAVQFANLNQ